MQQHAVPLQRPVHGVVPRGLAIAGDLRDQIVGQPEPLRQLAKTVTTELVAQNAAFGQMRANLLVDHPVGEEFRMVQRQGRHLLRRTGSPGGADQRPESRSRGYWRCRADRQRELRAAVAKADDTLEHEDTVTAVIARSARSSVSAPQLVSLRKQPSAATICASAFLRLNKAKFEQCSKMVGEMVNRAWQGLEGYRSVRRYVVAQILELLGDRLARYKEIVRFGFARPADLVQGIGLKRLRQ